MDAPQIISTLSQWPMLALVVYGAVNIYREKSAEVAAERKRSDEAIALERKKSEDAIAKLQADCAAERAASNAKHEALLRELLEQQTAVRDRELERTTKHIVDGTAGLTSLTASVAAQTRSITDMTGAVVAQTSQLGDMTAAILTRKSMQNIPKVGG